MYPSTNPAVNPGNLSAHGALDFKTPVFEAVRSASGDPGLLALKSACDGQAGIISRNKNVDLALPWCVWCVYH
jgi:hypothetical protein